MIQQEINISNKLGLHARASVKLTKVASKYPCEVHLEKDGQEVNGKSIMGVLMLVAAKGSQVTIITRGDQAKECAEALAALIADKFGEGK